MIPILYESNETGFNTNGLGRLRDCISCVVTEERNGIYVCDFEYPVDGAHFEDIRIGRIIGVEHDDTDDIQPFDIMSHERPIEGVVTFHCTHISYRLSKMTVSRSYISSLANAFYAIQYFATPSWNPFSFYTDKDSIGYVAAFDGLPRTARSLLGGREGSILDTYGGEYEWDKWTVKLLSARGAYRDLTVRYGVNMTDYNEEVDNSETYQSVIPYWTDGTDKVIGDQQTGPVKTITGRDDTVPLDLSDKFEVTDGNIPTKEQVEAMARTLLENGANALPVQRISVSFIRLQDAGARDGDAAEQPQRPALPRADRRFLLPSGAALRGGCRRHLDLQVARPALLGRPQASSGPPDALLLQQQDRPRRAARAHGKGLAHALPHRDGGGEAALLVGDALQGVAQQIRHGAHAARP